MYLDEKRQGEALPVIHRPEFWAAADYIERHGWCQGISERPTGEVCIMGALRKVLRLDLFLFHVADLQFASHVGAACTAFWNDAPWRTKTEVVATLRDLAMKP